MKDRNCSSLMRCASSLQRLFFLALLSIIAIGAYAQGKTVSGTVLDKSGESVIGASVVVKGTTNGTITDFDGKFTLSNVPNDASLEISFVGYKTQVIPVQGKNTFNVTMVEDTEVLDEVVVVGYGVQKKSDVTGAMASVGSKEIEARPVTNAMQALQGKAAGVDITSNERPGELGKVQIRGMRSMIKNSSGEYSGNTPLYVVDGVPLMSSSAIETINPRDIESIDILKDASATAIYGSRGANGVILVTTKKGKEGRFTLNYSGTLNVENVHSKSRMMNADEYITWRRWAAYNAGQSTYPGDQPNKDNDATIFGGVDPTTYNNIMNGWAGGTWDASKVTSTDWTDYVTQTGITHEHTLSASGGNEKMSAYASFGYLNQEGTFKGQGYRRYTGNVNIDLAPTKWFKLGASINASWSEQEYGVSTLGASSSGEPSYIYGWAEKLYAYSLPYDQDGNLIDRPGNDDNVYNVIGEWDKSQQQRQTFRALGSFYATLDFGEIYKPLEGLNFRLNFGPDFRNWREGVYIDSESVTRKGGLNFARLKNQRDLSWTLDEQINYNRTFGKHSVGATLLHTASSWNVENSEMSAYGIPQASWTWNAFSTIDITNPSYSAGMSSGITERQLESYMMRFNYGFNDRYLLTVSGRWDGASQLSAGNKWAFFPSAALAWRINQENFLKDVSWLDNLKLRVGFGTTGNAAVAPYGTLGNVQSNYLPFIGMNNQIFYTTNEPNYTKDQIGMPNKDLGWERTTQYNVGIDFSFLNGRISGSLDVYTSQTKDLLLSMKVPTLTGYPNTTANIGRTSNRGVDITLNLVPVRVHDFEWDSNISAAYTKDEIEELASGKTDDISNNWFIGKSIAVWYDVQNAGLWQDTPEDYAEMDKFNANGHSFKPGMVKPVDQNGDYKITDEDDRVILGNQNPRWTFGWTNTFSYKGIELSAQMYGRFKYMISTGGEAQLGRYNQRAIDYWTPSNTNAEYQMPIYNQSGGDAYSDLLGYKNANFLKMRNISLGYVLPKSIISKVGLSNLKVYVQANNPFTIYSSVDFIDLDLGGSTFNRGFVFGLDVTF